jgi:uroporphyrinogen-III synthase
MNSRLSPISGKTILVTRAAEQASDFCDRLVQVGAIPIVFPALEIGPPSSWQALDRSIANLSEVDWLILTSANGVDAFFSRLAIADRGLPDLKGIKIAVVGKKTAKILSDRGVNPDFIPPNFVADALIEYFPESVVGQTLLFPRVETGGRDVLVQQLAERGAQVIEVAAYESRCPEQIAPDALDALQRHAVEIVTFASSKTVKNFCQLIDRVEGISLDGVCIASIGPQTSQTCQQLLGRVDVEAKEYTLDGLFQALLAIDHQSRS